MKRIITLLILAMMLVVPTAAFALTETEAKVRGSTILPPNVVNNGERAVVPTDFMEGVVPQIIKLTLAMSATVTFVILVYSGVMLIIAQGNEEDMKKFKDTLIWAIVGLIFITTSYAIVRGVMLLSFQ
jgi:hypothetical protein